MWAEYFDGIHGDFTAKAVAALSNWVLDLVWLTQPHLRHLGDEIRVRQPVVGVGDTTLLVEWELKAVAIENYAAATRVPMALALPPPPPANDGAGGGGAGGGGGGGGGAGGGGAGGVRRFDLDDDDDDDEWGGGGARGGGGRSAGAASGASPGPVAGAGSVRVHGSPLFRVSAPRAGVHKQVNPNLMHTQTLTFLSVCLSVCLRVQSKSPDWIDSEDEKAQLKVRQKKLKQEPSDSYTTPQTRSTPDSPPPAPRPRPEPVAVAASADCVWRPRSPGCPDCLMVDGAERTAPADPRVTNGVIRTQHVKLEDGEVFE